MSLVLELVLQASTQLPNPLVTKGPNSVLSLLNHTHRNSTKCWDIQKKMKNELSIEVGASSIQPTLLLLRYRGPQH
jgi:hypothetical protein